MKENVLLCTRFQQNAVIFQDSKFIINIFKVLQLCQKLKAK